MSFLFYCFLSFSRLCLRKEALFLCKLVECCLLLICNKLIINNESRLLSTECFHQNDFLKISISK